MTLSEYLRKCREAAELTQYEVSKHLGFKCGQYVSNIERGKCGPPLKSLKDYAEKINADYETLVRLMTKNYNTKVKRLLGVE